MENGHDANSHTLSDLFNTTWKQFQQIENSDKPVVSKPYQDDVKSCIENLECCTRMVCKLSLFSTNEDVDEVTTGNLRFFLLPAFLGDLTLKTTGSDRKDCVRTANVYFKDFLKRCYCYKITKKDLSKYIENSQETNNNKTQNGTAKKPPPSQTREEKILIYKENKNFSSKIETMQKRLSAQPEAIDDDTTREYHLDWLNLWVNKCMEHISFAGRELEMLEMMEARGGQPPEPPKQDRPPMKPILITREMIQRQVFGAGFGYRNLPTMTEDEYFEKEVREGKIVLDYNPNATDDEKNGKKESEDEDETEHDEEKLRKARNWDEFKDTNRRGDGNRYGQG